MQHSFVEFIPNQLEEGMLYVSMGCCTAIHLCVCGCRNWEITPFSPTDWKMTFDGKIISLYPSIGNSNFDCQSHYWIKKSKVEWAGSCSDDQISKGREADQSVQEKYYMSKIKGNVLAVLKRKKSIWDRLLKIFNS